MKFGILMIVNQDCKIWCVHPHGDSTRIETDEKAARTIASLYKQSNPTLEYEVREIP